MLLRLLLMIALCTGFGAQAAEPVARTEHVTARLIAERTAAVPGATLRLALVQEIARGWHTYWRNPGDSGIPTELAWTLPPAWQAGPIVWPTPERIAVGPLVNHGYHGRVVLPVTVQVPESAVPGRDETLSVHASWLVCAEICIPEEVDLSLTLPIAAQAANDSTTSADFTATDLVTPTLSPWPAEIVVAPKALNLRVHGVPLDPARLSEVWFAAEDGTLLDHAAVQLWRLRDGVLTVDLPRAPGMSGPLPSTAGVLVLVEKAADGTTRHLAYTLTPAAGPTAEPDHQRGALPSESLLSVLLAAFAGGLILNLMPCVFPVLVLKGLSLARLGQAERGAARWQGLAYTVGVVTSFALLGGALLAARGAGQAVGWGFQLQNPPMVLALAYVLFAAGLGLSGLIQLEVAFAGAGQSLAERKGSTGAFFTGVLAVLVATPCTAPFMAGALGYAVGQSPSVAMSVFVVLGLGLAAPFLLLSLVPALARRLPRPGAWMARLKQGLAFPMYATAAWLVWVLAQQSGADGVLAALLGMLLIAFAAWVHGASRGASRAVTRLIGVVLALAGLLGAGALLRLPTATAAPLTGLPGSSVAWEPYKAARLSALLAEGRPVLIDATAAWCITCLINERAALSSERVAAALTAGNVVTLKADWTNRDPEVTALLASHGRAGVPLYLYYPPGGGAARELPQILTEGLVLDVLAGL